MDEITIGDKIYISSKRAAKITGYAKDYVGQLCREGRVEARLVGRNWYVLEAAIKEHRFGKEENMVSEDSESKMPEPEVIKTWQKPQYEALTPVSVPDIAPKANKEVTEEHKAVSDMQSAWREWFQERNQSAETVSKDKEESEEIVTFVEQVEEEAPQEVQISRIPDLEETSSINVTEEVVVLRRSNVVREEERELAVNDVIRVETAPLQQIRAYKSRKKGSSVVMRSSLVAASFLVALIAWIGSGYADSFLKAKSLDLGIQGNLVEFLTGTSEVKNNLK